MILHVGLNQLCKGLFPGSELSELTDEQCGLLVRAVLYGREMIHMVGSIQDIVSRALDHLNIQERERLRRVSQVWRLASELCHNTPADLRELLVRPERLSLALRYRDPRYLTIVRCQEDFDLLWPGIGYIIMPNPRFVRSHHLARAAQCALAYRNPSDEKAAWVLGLDYPVMVELMMYMRTEQRDLISPSEKTDATKGLFLSNASQRLVAHELSRMSRTRTLDPCKLFWFGVTFPEVIRCHLPQVRERRYASRAEHILSVCPEAVVFRVLVQGLTADDYPQIAKALLEEKKIEPVLDQCQAFSDACRRVLVGYI
jgi:hypothetical protein